MTQSSERRNAEDRGVARRRAFLLAARTVFLEHGYENASVNDVVRRAGGSLATLYAQFGNKEGLFLAIAQEQHRLFSQDSLPKGADDLGLEEFLQVFGERLLHAALSRDHLAFYRIIVGEGRKFPQLLQTYLSTGAAELRQLLGERIEAWGLENNIEISNPDLVAAYFIDLCRVRIHYQALADESFAPTDAKISKHVQHAVTFFMNGLRGATVTRGSNY